MRSEEVLRQRLATQRLRGAGADTAATVVEELTCVQSQEWAHGFWSLGLRTGNLGYADVQREFDAGRFLRTHILRPTWHFVSPADIGWVLAATSARVHQRNATMYRSVGLDRAALERGGEQIVAALTDRGPLTRAELGAVLGETGFRLVHLVMSAELDGLICSGPLRGAQHTYALLAERAPAEQARNPDHPVAELARRFFAGHGPAELADFVRWSSLSKADAEEGLALVSEGLESVEVDGVTLWFDPHAGPGGAATTAPDRPLLLPLYDEVTLSYPRINFAVADGHPDEPGTDVFIGSVIVGLTNVGTWRRTVKGRRIEVQTRLAPGVSAADRHAVADAVSDLARFLNRELTATE